MLQRAISNPMVTGAGGLLTDLYQLTMAYGYWKSGKADQEAVFHLLFRKQPFNGGFTLACGLADAIPYLRRFRFGKSDLDYLKGLKGNDGRRLFEPAFLKYLGELKLDRPGKVLADQITQVALAGDEADQRDRPGVHRLNQLRQLRPLARYEIDVGSMGGEP